jgi:hypothetical protein
MRVKMNEQVWGIYVNLGWLAFGWYWDAPKKARGDQ